MLLTILLLATSGLFSNIFANVVGGVVVLVVTVVGTAWMSQRRGKKEDRQKETKSNSDKLDQVVSLTNEMHVALVGATPSPMNPFPQPGLVEIVPDLLKRTTKIEHTLFTNGGKNNTIVDRMQRLEKKLDVGVASAGRIEVQQTDQEAARVERANGE